MALVHAFCISDHYGPEKTKGNLYLQYEIMHTITRVLILLLAGSLSLQAQDKRHFTKADTQEVEKLLNSAWTAARADPQLSLQTLHHADSFIKSRQTDYFSSVLLYYYGVVYKNLSRYDSSEVYFNRYIQYSKNKNDIRRLAPAFMAMANLYSDQNRYEKSMEAVTQSLQYFKDLKDTAGIITCQSKMGYLLSEIGRLDDAREYHLSSLDLSLQQKDTESVTIALTNLGLLFEKKQLHDSALIYFKKSEELDILLEDTYALADDRYNIGNTLMKMNRLDQAEPYLDHAVRLAQQIGQPMQIVSARLLLATLRLQQGRRESGITLMEEVLREFPDEISLKDRGETYRSLYEAFKEKGNLSRALNYLESWTACKDSIFNQEVSRQMNQLEVQYQTAQKDQALQLLNATHELTQSKLMTARARNYGLVAGLGLLVVLLFLLWRLWKKTRIQNVQIQKSLTEKETLLREIHHRVKNNLQFISSLLNLQARHVEDGQTRSVLREGQNRVKSMALIHQNLYQEHDLTGVEIKTYLERLIQNLFHSYNISPGRIGLSLDIDPIRLDVDTMVPLGLIVNELISNSLKYAFPEGRQGTIAVSLKEEKNILILQVSDDGIGLPDKNPAQEGNTFGYRLIHAFQNQLNASLDIHSRQGTTVTMRIQDYRKAS